MPAVSLYSYCALLSVKGSKTRCAMDSVRLVVSCEGQVEDCIAIVNGGWWLVHSSCFFTSILRSLFSDLGENLLKSSLPLKSLKRSETRSVVGLSRLVGPSASTSASITCKILARTVRKYHKKFKSAINTEKKVGATITKR